VVKKKIPDMAMTRTVTTRKGSDVVSIKKPPQTGNEPEAADSCFWWRRERVELHQKHGLVVLVAIRSAGMVTNGWVQQLGPYEYRQPA